MIYKVALALSSLLIGNAMAVGLQPPTQRSLEAAVHAEATNYQEQSDNYKKLYEDAKARYEQQKKKCAPCDAAEVALIAALTSAEENHKGAQGASDAVTSATTALSGAKAAYDAKKVEFANKKTTLKGDELTADSTDTAFDKVVATTIAMKGLANEETALENAMNVKQTALNTAKTAYDRAKGAASSLDGQITTLTAARNTACADLDSEKKTGGSAGAAGVWMLSDMGQGCDAKCAAVGKACTSTSREEQSKMTSGEITKAKLVESNIAAVWNGRPCANGWVSGAGRAYPGAPLVSSCSIYWFDSAGGGAGIAADKLVSQSTCTRFPSSADDRAGHDFFQSLCFCV